MDLEGSILIVDDVPDNIRLLSDMLTQAGFSVRQAVSGSMALMAVEANPPDLILLDINMPGMNGYEVCSHLKSSDETHDIPIIFLSALDAIADKVKSFDLGAADYVSKPFSQEEIIRRIRNQLSIYKLTRQLENQNQVLETALTYLKENQADIIQREKMAGLDQLISGVAHEINNPVSFIAGNLTHAEDYFQTLRQTIIDYREVSAVGEPDHDRQELDYVLEDFPQLLQSMAVGAERIKSIVQALQTFAHHGEQGVKPIDLQKTLESILILLQPCLRGQGNRPAIAIDRQYHPLPPVACDAKLIGQVFLDLLKNAIDSIDELWNSQTSNDVRLAPPCITLHTQQLDENWVEIKIRDTGIGITDEIQEHVYEPFFSTKPVGAGKGLGLTTSYRIITEIHRGKISFDSVPMQGTEFSFALPLG